MLLYWYWRKKKRKTWFCFYAPSIAPEVEWEEESTSQKIHTKTNPQDNFIVIKVWKKTREKEEAKFEWIVKKKIWCYCHNNARCSLFSGYAEIYTWEMILKKSLFILIDSLLMSFATFEMLTQVIVLMKSWPSSPMKMTGTNWSMTLSSRTS